MLSTVKATRCSKVLHVITIDTGFVRRRKLIMHLSCFRPSIQCTHVIRWPLLSCAEARVHSGTARVEAEGAAQFVGHVTHLVLAVVDSVLQWLHRKCCSCSTMNHKECVARGCALWRAAMARARRGPVLQVRDIYPFPTIFEYTVYGQPHCTAAMLPLDSGFNLQYRPCSSELRVVGDSLDQQYQVRHGLQWNSLK